MRDSLGVPHDMEVYNGYVYTLITVFENYQHTAQVYKNTQLLTSYNIDGFSAYEELKLVITKKSK